MVDAAEDTEYPADMPWLKGKGYEKEVCDYLLKNCADENGSVTLDFVVGTHAHSDHIGGFDTVIANPAITVKKAYLKPYSDDCTNLYERKRWDNDVVYGQMKAALEAKSVPIIENFEGEKTTLGNFKITFLTAAGRKMPAKAVKTQARLLCCLKCTAKGRCLRVI